MKSPLLRARERAGLSRNALARLCEMSPQNVWNLETRSQKPGLETAQRLAQALGTEVEKLWPTKGLA